METIPSVLTCTFYIKIDRPIQDVFDAVYRSDNLSQYFATGNSSGNLDEGKTVHWGFADYADGEPFPVKVIKTEAPRLIHMQWGSKVEGEWNDVKMEFEELSPTKTLFRVTESGWPGTPTGIEGSIENSGGWANMATCLKAFVEHGISLRSF